MYFTHALHNYSHVLRIGERSSLSAVLRFASLLFSSTLASSDEVVISSLFEGIPEQQFLPIFMQFIARLKDDVPNDGMFSSFTGMEASLTKQRNFRGLCFILLLIFFLQKAKWLTELRSYKQNYEN